MKVIDVDAHFEPGDDWLLPYPKLAAKLPKVDIRGIVTDAFVGELLREVPLSERPPIEELEPPGVRVMFSREKADEKQRRAEFGECEQFPEANAYARLKWMDEQGIDIQNVICLSALSYVKSTEDVPLRQELIEACNTWLADICMASGGRLLPVTCLEFTDIEWAVRELTRMRARGSRIFLVPGHPVNGVAPIHPSWERLWSAATDLGMVAMYHIGDGQAPFEKGWSNNGADATVLRQLGSAHKNVPALNLIYSMIYGGVFERHPNLTLVTAEVGVGWLPFLKWEIDHVTSDFSKLMLGDWTLPLKPSEYLARNVRGTPLAGVVCGGDQEIATIMDLLPQDMLVYSTDFPHFEGIHQPAAYYREKLSDVSQSRRDQFYGRAIADVYARMGDPIC